MKHKKSRSLVINKYGKSLENSVKLLKSINSWLVFYIIMKWSYHQNEVYPLIFVTAPHSNKEDKISFFNTLISSYRIEGTKLIDVKFNRSLIQTKKGSYPIHKSPTFAGSGRGDWLATLTTTTNQPPWSTNLNPQPAIFFFFLGTRHLTIAPRPDFS